jgi:hypothetical protein
MKNKCSYFNGFEKAKERGQKYFKIMVKLVQNSIRSTELSIAYSPCYGIVLMCHNSQIDAIPCVYSSYEIPYINPHYGLQCRVNQSIHE